MTDKIIANKVFLITGGATGIGLEITKHFLMKNAKQAIILDINEEKGKETELALNAQYGDKKVVFIKCNIVEDFGKVSVQIFEKYGRIDVLVNNAGIADQLNPSKCIDVNLKSLIKWSYKFIEKARKDKGGLGGVILNVASILGVRSLPFFPVYQATKHGVIGFTRALGDEKNYAITGVRVVAMCPGFTTTNIFSTRSSQEMVNPIQTTQAYEETARVSNFTWQKPEVVGAAAVEIVERGDTGSAWVIANGLPIKEVKFL